MTVLSRVDTAAEIACTLPAIQAAGRLSSLQTVVGDRLDRVSRIDGRLRIRIARAGSADLEAEVTAWAESEKDCCAFLGFAVESEDEAVTVEIAAPDGAESTLEVFDWAVRVAGAMASQA